MSSVSVKEIESSKPLHVLFTDYGIGFGGAVVSMSNLVGNLAKNRDLNVSVLSAQSKEIILPLLNGMGYVYFPMPINYFVKEKFQKKLKSLSLPDVLYKLSNKLYALVDYFAGLYYRRILFNAIKKNKVNLVHINNAPDINTILAAKQAKVPCVIHCRGLDELDRKAIEHAQDEFPVKKFIAISSAVADFLRREGVPDTKIVVVSNPVDWQQFLNAQAQREIVRNLYTIATESVVVSIFGRVTEWKGQLEFLQAVELVIDRCPNLLVMIVGDSSDDAFGYQKKVEEYSRRSALLGRVVFTGYQQQVADYYWASDIVVHNSTSPEPFGRVLIEAMACCRPVIAMQEGGPLDIITSGSDGVLVPPRDILSLAKAIEALYNSPSDREMLGQNAGKVTQLRFNGESIAQQVFDVYSTIFPNLRGK